MELSKWNSDDLKQHKQLDDLLGKNVSWNVSTAELVQVYRSLVWFAGIREKIEQSQAEILAVYNNDPEKPTTRKSK